MRYDLGCEWMRPKIPAAALDMAARLRRDMRETPEEYHRRHAALDQCIRSDISIDGVTVPTVGNQGEGIA